MSKTHFHGDADVDGVPHHKPAHKFTKSRRWDKATYDAAPRTVRDAEEMRESQAAQADSHADAPRRSKDRDAPVDAPLG